MQWKHEYDSDNDNVQQSTPFCIMSQWHAVEDTSK